MEILGYIGAIAIGLILGLTGGGGSLLTVPILVYILHINPVIATAYSLFIVGTTSIFGTLQNYKSKNVDFNKGILFAIPSLIAVFLTRKYLVPLLPDFIIQSDSFVLTKGSFIMLFFSFIMFLAALSMLRTKKSTTDKQSISKVHFFIQNLFIGVIIGFVGAGGGFLIIPSLVILAKFPIKKAIGTSLFIISLNSLFGFLGDVQNITIDWLFLLKFTSLSIVGIFLGSYFSKKINEKKLKQLFAYFVLLMSLTILVKEIL